MKAGSGWAGRAIAGVAFATALAAGAAEPTVTLEPQGAVSVVRQALARFSEPMRRSGNSRESAGLLVLRCDGPGDSGVDGEVHWLDARTLALDFAVPLDAHRHCTLALGPGLRTAAGIALPPTLPVSLHTGAPTLRTIVPAAGRDVRLREHQAFALRLTGPVDAAQVSAQARCEVTADGAVTRMGVLPIVGEPRALLAKALRFEHHLDLVATFTCAQPLPAGARVAVVWTSERSADDPSPPAEARVDYRVDPGFSASVGVDCGLLGDRLQRRGGLRCDEARHVVDEYGVVTVKFSNEVLEAQARRVLLVDAGGARPPRDDELARFHGATAAPVVRAIRFKGPFSADAALRVVVPADLVDRFGGHRIDAADSPVAVTVARSLPEFEDPVTLEPGPLAVQGRTGAAQVKAALLPGLRLRGARVLRVPAQARDDAGFDDAPLMRWAELAQRFQGYGYMTRPAVLAGLDGVAVASVPALVAGAKGGDDVIATSSLSLLDTADGSQAARIDDPDAARGVARQATIALDGPGLQVVELGYEAPPGDIVSGPAYERSAVLVTDLAVHVLSLREGGLAWVTSLSTGLPVAGASVQVSDCHGTRRAAGLTDARGVVALPGWPDAIGSCKRLFDGHGAADRFVTARRPLAGGMQDVAFAWTSWSDDLAMDTQRMDGMRDVSFAHSGDAEVRSFAGRSLLAPGQEVSMKHWLRLRTADGLAIPPRAQWPAQVVLVDPAGDRVTLPLQWSDNASASWHWTVPAGARRGDYDVTLPKDGRDDPVARFSVRDFRVPEAVVTLAPVAQPWRNGGPATFEATARYLNGGPAVGLAVDFDSTLTQVAPGSGPAFYGNEVAGFPGLSFDRQLALRASATQWEADEGFGQDFDDDLEDSFVPDVRRTKGVRQTALVDAQGHARFRVAVTPSDEVSRVTAGVRYDDPDGEVVRLAAESPAWPAARRAGLMLTRQADGQMRIDAAVVDLAGHPVAGVPVRLDAGMISSRREQVDAVEGIDIVRASDVWTPLALPASCGLVTAADGRASCQVSGIETGRFAVDAHADDGAGGQAHVEADQFVSWHGDGGGNVGDGPAFHARHLSARTPLDPLFLRVAAGAHRVGESVRAVVPGRFDEAPALVTVSREGVLETRLVTLDGVDPGIDLVVDHRWMPGVTVGVQVLQSTTLDHGQGHVGTRPAPILRDAWNYLNVDTGPLKLAVDVKVREAGVRPGETAHLRVRVTRADGGPAPAGTRVALAVVDEALFRMMPDTRDVLDTLRDRPRWNPASVASAQGLVPAQPADVGLLPDRYAAPALQRVLSQEGIGRQEVVVTGSRIARDAAAARLRSVFDTALAWRPDVPLDSDGNADIEVPTNDSLARWRVIAVADATTAQDALITGSGQGAFTTRQPLQLSAGLPPVVRTGDRSVATVTVRNETGHRARVRVTARTGGRGLADREVELADQARADVSWDAVAPAAPGETVWEFGAATLAADAGVAPEADRLQFRQRVLARVPTTVRSGTLVQVDRGLDVPLQPLGREAARVSVQALPSLARELPGVSAWLASYPYNCLEQRVSRAIGQRDEAAWTQLMAELPSYFDVDDLLSWFPPRRNDDGTSDVPVQASGSDILTSYVLAASAQAQAQGLPFALPQALQQRLVDALSAAARGTLERGRGEAGADGKRDVVLRRLAAVEALSRVGAADPGMLADIPVDLGWPTSSLIDLRLAVARLPAFPDRAATLARVDAALRARLDVRGTRVTLVADRGGWGWMMRDGDVDMIRLATLAAGDPAWQDIAPRLMAGALSLQRQGHWSTTVANALGTLLVADFARGHETQPVRGELVARLAGQGVTARVDWAATPAGATVDLPLPPLAAPTLHVEQHGSGAPWVSVLERAAVDTARPVNHGFAIRKTVVPLTPHPGGALERGDIVTVHLEIQAVGDATWVAIDDPLPAGATLLGGAEIGDWWNFGGGTCLAYIDKRFDRFQAFWSRVAAGRFSIDYTMRLDTAGRFGLPATRVEAMYAPDMFGESPNAPMLVGARR